MRYHRNACFITRFPLKFLTVCQKHWMTWAYKTADWISKDKNRRNIQRSSWRYFIIISNNNGNPYTKSKATFSIRILFIINIHLGTYTHGVKTKSKKRQEHFQQLRNNSQLIYSFHSDTPSFIALSSSLPLLHFLYAHTHTTLTTKPKSLALHTKHNKSSAFLQPDVL